MLSCTAHGSLDYPRGSTTKVKDISPVVTGERLEPKKACRHPKQELCHPVVRVDGR